MLVETLLQNVSLRPPDYLCTHMNMLYILTQWNILIHIFWQIKYLFSIWILYSSGVYIQFQIFCSHFITFPYVTSTLALNWLNSPFSWPAMTNSPSGPHTALVILWSLQGSDRYGWLSSAETEGFACYSTEKILLINIFSSSVTGSFHVKSSHCGDSPSQTLMKWWFGHMRNFRELKSHVSWILVSEIWANVFWTFDRLVICLLI